MLIKLIKINFFIFFINLTISNLIYASDDLIIEIDNPKFSEKGLDDKVYEIKANKGLKSEKELELFSVEGKFKSNKGGKWIYLQADKGIYDQSANFIRLEKDIKFYTDEGEALRSDKATFDLEKDIVTFNDNISHKNFGGLILADTSIITENFNKLTYVGNINATFKLKE